MDASSGTRPVAVEHAFDVKALQDYLRSRLPGFKGPLEVAQFKGGQSNPTFLLHTPAARYVLRAKPAPMARLLPSAHAIEREYRVMRALAGTEVPVAATHVLCEDESVIGRAFYVMDFVEGRVFWDQSLPQLRAAGRHEVYDEMNRVVATLQAVDPVAAGLGDYGRGGNYFERQVGRWSKQYRASELEPIAAMDRLIAWLPQALPASARDASQMSLVHGDFRIDNLIFHPTEPRVLAVLDWELSTLGHPLADFSYNCIAWHIPHATGRGIAGLDLARLGLPLEQDYVRRYCERSGRSLDTFAADWNFYLAYNLFRLAAIAQGVAHRAAGGVAASAQAREAGALARPLAELGWSYASARSGGLS